MDGIRMLYCFFPMKLTRRPARPSGHAHTTTQAICEVDWWDRTRAVNITEPEQTSFRHWIVEYGSPKSK